MYIESNFAPTLYTSPYNGQKYIVGIGINWIAVPDTFTIADVNKLWIRPKPKPIIKPKISRKVISRKREFTVTLTDIWSCTCSTYKSKKKCSHIDSVKSEL